MNGTNKSDTVKTVDDLPNPNGPGTIPISKDAHKMVQKERGVDPHRRSGDRNVHDKGNKGGV